MFVHMVSEITEDEMTIKGHKLGLGDGESLLK